jgi:hypothetical protein
MNRPLFLASWVAAAALSAAAAPPNRAHISADPAWILHIDCDALRETYIGKYLLYHMNKPEMNTNMAAFQALFSFDLRTQLHGLTIYSDGPVPNDAVVILYADFDPEHVIGLLKRAGDTQVATNNRHVIYSWIDKKQNPNGNGGPRNYGVVQKGFMAVSKDNERLNTALAVMDGTAPNLSTGKALPELDTASDATFVQASARNLDFLGPDPKVALLKMSRRTKFRASEADEQLNAVLTLEVGDEAKARQMSVAAQGLVALVGLQQENPKAASLAASISVKQNGGTMTATLSAPSTDLIAALKVYFAEKEKAQAETK